MTKINYLKGTGGNFAINNIGATQSTQTDYEPEIDKDASQRGY